MLRYLIWFIIGLAFAWPSNSLWAQQPNIILINVDDLDVELFDNGRAGSFFPNLQQLAQQSVRFNNCHVTSPLCGPSRASLLTGLYVHRHGVRVQQPGEKIANGFSGGFTEFKSQQLPGTLTLKPDWTKQDLGIAMKTVGYRTMLVGKYLHAGFAPQLGQTWQDLHPAGWDDFYCSLSGRYYDVNQYLGRRGAHTRNELRNTNEIAFSEYDTSDRYLLNSRYRTNIEFLDAWYLIRDHKSLSPDQPFFLYLAPFAPHLAGGESIVDTKYEHWWTNLRQPKMADFNHAAASDKPEALRVLEPLTQDQIQLSDQEYRSRLLAMRSVDDMLGILMERLEAENILQDTIIIFTSDNGYMLGHQRHFGKQLPYDRCTRVPFLVWGPSQDIAINQDREHLISHVDIFPTLLQLAGSNSSLPLDGQPIGGLFHNGVEVPSAENWRPNGVLSEHYQRLGHAWKDIEGVYRSVRFHSQRFTQWGDGLEEYYDLLVDPLERDNQLPELDAGDQNLFNLLLRSALADELLSSTIGVPDADSSLIFRSQEMMGYAHAATGVNQVRLVFSRTGPSGQREYLHGEDWQTDYYQNLATLESPGQTVSRWDFSFHPAGDGQYPVTMTVRAYANDGSYQSQVTQQLLTVEHDPPATAILSHAQPYAEIPHGRNCLLGGSAKGAMRITQVRVVIRDTNTNRYFDGVAWRNSYQYVQAEVQTPNGDDTYRLWSLELPADQLVDRMYINARAYQQNGKFDTTVPWTILHKK